MMSLDTLLEAAKFIERQERKLVEARNHPPPIITFKLPTSEAEPAVSVPTVGDIHVATTIVSSGIVAAPRNGLAVVVQPRTAPVCNSSSATATSESFIASASIPASTPVAAHLVPVVQQTYKSDVRSTINGLSAGAAVQGGASGNPQAGAVAVSSAMSPAAVGAMMQQQRGGAGTREVHNKLEKNRRAHLKECFELLKRQLPPTADDKKTSNLSILGSAIRYIQALRRKERESEHEMERLAREKIAAQQRLASLRRQAASRRRRNNSSDPVQEHQQEPVLIQLVGGVDNDEIAERVSNAASVITSLCTNLNDRLSETKRSPSPPQQIQTYRVSSPPNAAPTLYNKPRLQTINQHQVVNLQPQDSAKPSSIYKVNRSSPSQPVQTIYSGANGLPGVCVTPLASVVSLAGIPVSMGTPSYTSTLTINPSLPNATSGILNLSVSQQAAGAARKHQVSALTVTSMQHQNNQPSVPLSVSRVSHLPGVVVGGALQLVSPGALRVLHSPHIAPIDLHPAGGAASAPRRNGLRIFENGHITPPPQGVQVSGDDHPASLVVSGLTPLVVSQSGAHIITAPPHINGKMASGQYLPAALVKPVVVVSSSSNGSSNL